MNAVWDNLFAETETVLVTPSAMIVNIDGAPHIEPVIDQNFEEAFKALLNNISKERFV